MKRRDCQTSAAEGVKKPAPSIPRTVLLEPYLFDQELFDITAKGGKLLLTAIRIHPQGAAQIQTEHFHEALSVGLVVGVPDNNREPPRRGQRHKFLNILNRLEPNLKFYFFFMLLFVAAAYIVELIFSQPNLAQLSKGMIIPSLPTSEAVFLAAGVLGATIMPHVIYLHSSLTQHLHGGTRKERYSATKWDVAIAMTIAGFVNLAMMATAAAAFHFNGHTGIADLDQAYLTLEPLLSHAAATIFGLSLVAAGLSSTVVGTLAGQVVMQGFVRFHIPLWVRRSVTMLPSFVVILMGLDPTRILVMSQVLLSFGIALALVPLLIFTSDKSLMGELVNSTLVKRTGWVIVAVVVSLNLWLLVGTALGL